MEEFQAAVAIAEETRSMIMGVTRKGNWFLGTLLTVLLHMLRTRRCLSHLERTGNCSEPLLVTQIGMAWMTTCATVIHNVLAKLHARLAYVKSHQSVL